MKTPEVRVPMTEERAGALIYLVRSLDPFERPKAPDTPGKDAALRTLWFTTLAHVDAAWAKRSIEAYYRLPAPDYGTREALTCTRLAAEWDTQVERLRARTERPAARVGVGPKPPWFDAVVAASREAAREVRANYPNRTHPQEVMDAAVEEATRDLIPTARQSDDDEQGRRCAFWETCACTHTECRKGWLDEDRVVIKHGREYAQTVRCPRCEEAVMMAEELREENQRARRRR